MPANSKHRRTADAGARWQPAVLLISAKQQHDAMLAAHYKGFGHNRHQHQDTADGCSGVTVVQLSAIPQQTAAAVQQRWYTRHRLATCHGVGNGGPCHRGSGRTTVTASWKCTAAGHSSSALSSWHRRASPAAGHLWQHGGRVEGHPVYTPQHPRLCHVGLCPDSFILEHLYIVKPAQPRQLHCGQNGQLVALI